MRCSFKIFQLQEILVGLCNLLPERRIRKIEWTLFSTSLLQDGSEVCAFDWNFNSTFGYSKEKIFKVSSTDQVALGPAMRAGGGGGEGLVEDFEGGRTSFGGEKEERRGALVTCTGMCRPFRR